MSEILLGCPGLVELTDVEIAWLDHLYGAVNEVAGRHYCELETGHAGRHAALGQRDVRGDWWVWWAEDDGSREILLMDPCPVEQDTTDPDQRPCLLPIGHAGGHSYPPA
jgi:hypothetical protein